MTKCFYKMFNCIEHRKWSVDSVRTVSALCMHSVTTELLFLLFYSPFTFDSEYSEHVQSTIHSTMVHKGQRLAHDAQ